MKDSKVYVLTCTSGDGKLVFNRVFRDLKKAEEKLISECQSLNEETLNQGVKRDEIIVSKLDDDNTIVCWIEDGESHTWRYGITEEEIE